MTMWTLTLHRLPISMNERQRTHWGVLHREVREITAEIGWLARQERVPRATSRRYVQITIHKGPRSRKTDDPGNRDSRSKAVLDALVHNGLLVDDSDEWLEWGGVVEGEKRATKQTVVLIREPASQVAA